MKKRPGTKHRAGAAVQETAARVELKSSVLKEIRQHARRSMAAEICGVLIGRMDGGMTFVDASIQGEGARQGGSHVTFTQETWTHVHSVKDEMFPDARIVGWYHSHPGFGVFLSDHDLFIHRNFFADPNQLAWVFDPHSDEEGCFGWRGGDIRRLSDISVHDNGPSEPSKNLDTADFEISAGGAERPAVRDSEEGPAKNGTGRRAIRWMGLILSYLVVLAAGVITGAWLAPQVAVVPETALHSKDVRIAGPDEAGSGSHNKGQTDTGQANGRQARERQTEGRQTSEPTK